MATTMSNNVATVTVELSQTIGGTITITQLDITAGELTQISGEINLGCIVFDENGVMGVCTNVTAVDTSTIYTIETLATSPDTVITNYLAQSY